MRSRNGFTMVELMMVVAVLALLLGIVTTGATAAMRNARAKRADAMRATLQAGLAAYYATNDEWPGVLKSYSENGIGTSARQKLLAPADTDTIFQKIVEASVKRGSPGYLDASGLFGGPRSSGRKQKGRDFRGADVTGSGWKTSFKVFGYPDRETSYLRRYWIEYNLDTDQATVLLDSTKRDRYKNDYTNE